MTTDSVPLKEAGELLVARTRQMRHLGFSDDQIADDIRTWNLSDNIRVYTFGCQWSGCYVRSGLRYPHDAVPGWYQVVAMADTNDQVILASDASGEIFETSAHWIRAVLSVNLDILATMEAENV